MSNPYDNVLFKVILLLCSKRARKFTVLERYVVCFKPLCHKENRPILMLSISIVSLGAIKKILLMDIQRQLIDRIKNALDWTQSSSRWPTDPIKRCINVTRIFKLLVDNRGLEYTHFFVPNVFVHFIKFCYTNRVVKL